MKIPTIVRVSLICRGGLKVVLLVYLKSYLRKNTSSKEIWGAGSPDGRFHSGDSACKSTLTPNSRGFTLIELLVVIAIIGILAAIALPNFLGNVAKAKQSEAKTTISSVNRAQAAYRTENDNFAASMNELGVGLPTTSTNYSYQVGGSSNQATIIATSRDTALKGYSGGVVQHTDSTGNSALASVICEANSPGIEPPETPALNVGASTPEEAAICPVGTSPL